MDEHNLLYICLNAFVAVMVLLSLLTLLLRLLITLFPERAVRQDSAITSAIQTAVSNLYPGARVTRMEEIKRGSRS